MGCFSWIYSDTNKQMINGRFKESFLLVPEKFQEKYGKAIMTKAYDGYGRFGENDEFDVFALIPEWNKEFIPDLIQMAMKGKCKHEYVIEDVLLLSDYYEDKDISFQDLRWIGIMMACRNEDNASLPYPIKIVENGNLRYEDALPSKSDPNQGFC